MMIVRELIAKGLLKVTKLQQLLRVPQSTYSVTVVKKHFKMVSYEQKENEVYYIVSDEKVIEFMNGMFATVDVRRNEEYHESPLSFYVVS
ncbi:ArsR family transcriptional regulator [Bacillus thuringiensis]|uniref:ArsR family transcriptional regulator n=1 Tax=Bacillus thuringiensis TaxID=1428 RepID=UPI002AC9908A|nr:ArsR family transcriptional regulator [Bacillus thuringiensis]